MNDICKDLYKIFMLSCSLKHSNICQESVLGLAENRFETLSKILKQNYSLNLEV